VPQEVKAVGHGETVKGAEAPGSGRGDSAASENESWRLVGGGRGGAEAARDAGEGGGEGLLRGGER